MEIDWYTTGWLLAVYTIGTFFGYRIAYRNTIYNII